MKRWLFLIHRWLGIALGLFFLLWFFSGLVMIFSGSRAVTQQQRLSHAQPIGNASGWLSLEEAWRLGALPRPMEARLSLVNGMPVWQVADEQGRRHALSALDGTALTVSVEAAIEIARQWGGHSTSPQYIETIEKDLGTRMMVLDPYRPFHKVALGDEAGTQLDISSRTGDVVSATTRLQRALAYSGEWLHYLRFMDFMGFSDRQRRFVLTWVSFIACFASLTGLVVGWLRWRPGWRGAGNYRNRRVHPYSGRFQRWHFCLGLVGGIMALTWMVSGFFANNPWGMFSKAMFGREQLVRFQDGPLPAEIAALRPESLLPANAGVVELSLRKVGSRHFIQAYDGSGALRPIDGVQAGALDEGTLLAAAHRMFPSTAIKSSELISAYDAYYYPDHRRPIGERPLPAWRVELDDADGHGLYVDPVDGRLLLKIDSGRRAYRWLFSALHNWDLGALYSRPLWDMWMIVWSLLGLALSVTAIIIGGRRLKSKIAVKPRGKIQTVSRLSPERAAGLAFVLALHAAALWGLWQHRLLPASAEVATLFVNFIAPPAPEKKQEPKRPPPPKPRPIEKPQPRQIVAETPVVAPTDTIAPPPPPEPAPAPVIEAPPMPLPAGPVALSSELAVACPERSAPAYPAASRRYGETGTVVLRVELDESGHVAVARVSSSSGHARLDEAALAVVKTWRCTPATRNGQPVRAVALQPFKFVLQGS